MDREVCSQCRYTEDVRGRGYVKQDDYLTSDVDEERELATAPLAIELQYTELSTMTLELNRCSFPKKSSRRF